jgi:hypothetical protein
MGKKNKEATTKRKRTAPVEVELALIEYVRADYSTYQAEKLTGIHHTRIKRLWESLSLEEKDRYIERAGVVKDAVEQHIISEEIAVVSELTGNLKEVGNLALDELKARLQDDLRRMDMKDADLIAIATKCLTMFEKNISEVEDKEGPSASVTNIYNILDNSIQENLQINAYNYEKE